MSCLEHNRCKDLEKCGVALSLSPWLPAHCLFVHAETISTIGADKRASCLLMPSNSKSMSLASASNRQEPSIVSSRRDTFDQWVLADGRAGSAQERLIPHDGHAVTLLLLLMMMVLEMACNDKRTMPYNV